MFKLFVYNINMKILTVSKIYLDREEIRVSAPEYVNAEIRYEKLNCLCLPKTLSLRSDISICEETD
jgi:hypothetical protein